MDRTSTRIASLIATVVLVAGCGGAAAPSASSAAVASVAPSAAPSPTASPAPTPSPTPSPSPEPTPHLATIGAAYLAIADIFATRGQPLIDDIAAGGSYTPEEWGDKHRKVAEVYDEVLAKMDEIDFPPELTDEATELRARWVTVRDLFLEVADDPSVDNWDEFVAEATAYGKIGDRIRSSLGLPPRPTPAS